MLTNSCLQEIQRLEQQCEELRGTIKQLEHGKAVLQNEVDKALGEQFRYQQQMVELRIQVPQRVTHDCLLS